MPDAPPDLSIPSPAPALDYVPRPAARRRFARRTLRLWPVWCMLLAAGLAWVYGPRVWARWKLLQLQEACLTTEMPADRPVWERDANAARVLVAARPGEYVLNRYGHVARVDPRWAALAAELGVAPWPVGPSPMPTTFCHERFTPDGRRRGIVAEAWNFVTVIEPGGWFGGGPRVVRSKQVNWDSVSFNAIDLAMDFSGPSRTSGGVPDPVDRSRFTVSFVLNGVAGMVEYRLGDDDRVTIRLLDPDGFIRRAKAARAAAIAAKEAPATRPTVGNQRGLDPS